ncbi:hypothetical protein SAMN05216302_10147 [Nitrosomonas aestuarii]|uniref:Uncharacterized protein n=1 Tax=Nitrosomonas aestuarii TaxID=52441 RepID=A0A1I4BYD9_9PROT|nr:hypothetical protein SAMN05216302_10147 [Nitrosomonas aestuarii]
MNLNSTLKYHIPNTSYFGNCALEFLLIILLIGKPSLNEVLNPSLFRRYERKLVGMLITVMMWLLERVVLRSIKRDSRQMKS